MPDFRSFAFAAALSDVKAGRPVAKAVSKPYGCTIKYG